MSRVGRVSTLWRYPVKSMLGEELATVDLESRGVVGDRCFAVRNAEGKLGSGKSTRRFGRVDGLLRCRASLDAGTPCIALPSGRNVRGEGPDVDAELTAAIGEPLALVREAAVSHLDAAPVHLVTTASLRWLESRLGEPADVRRFRPNVVIEVPGADLAEDGWVGRVVQLGETELRITTRTVRCVMTTLPQPTLDRAPAVLTTLAHENEACLGVYAEVLRGGPVRIGDAVILT